MYGEDNIHQKLNPIPQNISNDDSHRRKLMFATMQGKLNAAVILLEEAIAASVDGKSAYNSKHYDLFLSQKSSEAIFAAVDEALTYLNNIKAIAVKTGCNKSVDIMPKYADAINYNNTHQ